MADIDWPDSLPQTFLTEDFQGAAANNVLRSEMDRGPAKQRKFQTAGPKPQRGSMVMTSAQVSTFITFWDTTLNDGEYRFNFFDQFSYSSVEIRFTEQYSYKKAGPDRWRIGMAIEIMP